MAARELRKRCDCAKSGWSKCGHGWYFHKQVGRRRLRLSLDAWLGHPRCRTVADAETVRDAILRLIKAGTFSELGPPQADAPPPAPPTPAPPPSPTLQVVITAHLEAERGNPERTPRYVTDLASKGRVLAASPLTPPRDTIATLGALPVTVVDNACLEAFYGGLVRRQRSASQRNKYLGYLRGLGRWAKRHGYVPVPWLVRDETHLKRRKGAKRSRRLAAAVVATDGTVLVVSEEDRLLAVAGPHLRDLMIGILEAGARLGELLALLWRDVDRARGEIKIYDCKDPDKVTFRIVPIQDRLDAVLGRRRIAIDGSTLPGTAYVFGNEIGERVKGVSTAWENCALKAHGQPVVRDPVTKGLTGDSRKAYRAIDLVLQDLRREAASRWLEAGWELHEIQAMLGHQSLTTTEIYLNVRAGQLKARMRRHNALRLVTG